MDVIVWHSITYLCYSDIIIALFNVTSKQTKKQMDGHSDVI